MPRWLFTIALFLCSAALQAQEYVGRYDFFGGFTYLDSPHIHLSERGFHFQTGVHVRRWLVFGFDYSVATGHTSLEPTYLTTQLQQQLSSQLGPLIAAGLVPSSYRLSVPFDSKSQTFAAGPQIDVHHFSWGTVFVRPSIGAIHEDATLHPADPIANMIVAQFAPSRTKTDWVAFYGFGGGASIRITDHFAIRAQADFVHDHLFSDLLKDGRNTVRLSIGPSFQFGSNVR